MTEIERLENEIGELRELLSDAYIRLSGKRVHASDCATSDAPAYTPKECDCQTINSVDEIPVFKGTLDQLNDL